MAWLEIDKLPPEPDETATVEERRAAQYPDGRYIEDTKERMRWETLEIIHRWWVIAREGRITCALTRETDRDGRLHGKHPPPPRRRYFYLTNRSDAHHFGWSDPFCSRRCAIRWCEHHPFDAKDYWLKHGKRCACCQRLWNEDSTHGGSGPLVACGLNFCTPRCLIAHFEKHPELMTGWVSSDETFPPDRRDDFICGCRNCKKDEPDARYLTADSPYYYSRFFSDHILARFCSTACLLELARKEAEGLERNGVGPWYETEEEQPIPIG
jgi:hypothetical protein